MGGIQKIMGMVILVVIQCYSCYVFLILYNSTCYDIILGFRLRYEIFNEIEITAMIDFGKLGCQFGYVNRVYDLPYNSLKKPSLQSPYNSFYSLLFV